HYIGSQPYDTKCSARDSWIMALFTFGEGYHNYHHSFQWDYRNGVKPYHFDPTKWAIKGLEKLGLVSELRRVPEESILLAEMRETLRRLELHVNATDNPRLEAARERLNEVIQQFQDAMRQRMSVSRDMVRQWREFKHEVGRLMAAHPASA